VKEGGYLSMMVYNQELGQTRIVNMKVGK